MTEKVQPGQKAALSARQFNDTRDNDFSYVHDQQRRPLPDLFWPPDGDIPRGTIKAFNLDSTEIIPRGAPVEMIGSKYQPYQLPGNTVDSPTLLKRFRAQPVVNVGQWKVITSGLPEPCLYALEPIRAQKMGICAGTGWCVAEVDINPQASGRYKYAHPKPQTYEWVEHTCGPGYIFGNINERPDDKAFVLIYMTIPWDHFVTGLATAAFTGDQDITIDNMTGWAGYDPRDNINSATETLEVTNYFKWEVEDNARVMAYRCIGDPKYVAIQVQCSNGQVLTAQEFVGKIPFNMQAL